MAIAREEEEWSGGELTHTRTVDYGEKEKPKREEDDSEVARRGTPMQRMHCMEWGGSCCLHLSQGCCCCIAVLHRKSFYLFLSNFG